jgi:hypothetical protein
VKPAKPPAAEKNKETVSNTRDRIANKQLHDFVLNNKKKENKEGKSMKNYIALTKRM